MAERQKAKHNLGKLQHHPNIQPEHWEQRKPPRHNLTIFDTHSDIGNYFKDAQYEIKALEQESVKTILSNIGTVNKSVRESLHN